MDRMELGIGHAEFLGPLVHESDESIDVFSNVFCNSNCDIIGRGDHHGFHHFRKRKDFSLFQIHLPASNTTRPGRNFDGIT